MTAATGGLDLLVLTGGVGEHSWQVRAALAEALPHLGVGGRRRAQPGDHGRRRHQRGRRGGAHRRRHRTRGPGDPPTGPRRPRASAERGPAARRRPPAAQARTASQSRKSPSGARIAVTIARSPKLSRSLSRRPANTWCPRAPTSWLSGWTSCGSSGGKGGEPIGPLENSQTGRVAQGGRVRAHPVARGLPPPAGVDRAADEDGVEPGRRGRVLRLLEEDRQPDRAAVVPVGQLAHGQRRQRGRGTREQRKRIVGRGHALGVTQVRVSRCNGGASRWDRRCRLRKDACGERQ